MPDKAALDRRREQEDRLDALDQYRLDHHEAYRHHTVRRRAASMTGRAEAERLFPGMDEIRKAHKHARLHLKRWDNANPNPMSWEDYRRLEAEFSAIA